MINKSDFKLFDALRGAMEPGEYLEVLAAGALLSYLSKHPKYSSKVNMEILLRSGENINSEIQKVFNEIEYEIPYFSGVFKELDAVSKINAAPLTRILYEFNAMNTQDIKLTEWFEHLIDFINEQAGKKDQYSTPKSINKLGVAILNPLHGTFNDSAAGLGGGLLEAAKYAEENGKSIKFFGQELNSKTWAIAKVRIFIAGIEDAEIQKGDALYQPAFRDENSLKKFDFVFMEAPFSMPINNYDFLENDPFNRFFYGLPPRRSGDLAFISHALASLNETGKAVIVTTEGALFRGASEGVIRKNILASDLIEAVISLPAGLHQHTGIPVNLVLFNKNKDSARRNKVLMVKAEEYFTEIGRSKRILSENDIMKIVKVIRDGEEIPEFSTFIETRDIQDDSLLPSKYLLSSQMELSGFGKVTFSIEAFKKVNTVELKEVANFFRGFNVGSKNQESEDGEYRIVKLSDVQNGQLLIEEVSRYNIDNKAKVDMYALQKGDVILSVRGQTLKVALVPDDDEKLLLSQNFLGIRCGSRIKPEFLKVYLESPVGQYLLTSKMSGTAIATLSKSDIESLEVPLLPIEEQEEMMDKYTSNKKAIEQKIQDLERKLYEMKLQSYSKMGLQEVFEIKG